MLVRREDVCDLLRGILVDMSDQLVLLIETIDAADAAVAVLLALNEEPEVVLVTVLQ